MKLGDRHRYVRLTVLFGAGAAALCGAALALSLTGGGSSAAQPGSYAQALGLTRTVVAAAGPSDPWMKSIADLDGDGKRDLIVAGANGPTVWYRNPDWRRSVISRQSASESGSATADLDRDGDADVVVGTTWYENLGRGRAWRPHRLGEGGTHDIVIADFDRDGKRDVAMRGETDSPIDVFFQQSKTKWKRIVLDPGYGKNGLAAGDVDGNGTPDLVVGGRWLQNPGRNAAKPAAWRVHRFADWSEWAAVAIADVNRDRRPDVVLSVSEQGGDVAWFEAPKDPTRGWKRHTIATGLDSVHSVDVVDVNGDRRPDVVGSEFRGKGRLMAFLNRPGGRWEPGQVSAGENLHNTRVADVNGDGRPDILGAAPFGVQPVVVYLSAPTENRVLVFSKTTGFRHDSIPHAVETLKKLGAANGFAVDATEDSAAFTPANLARYRAVVFLNPSGNVLDDAQRAAFQDYVRDGNGFVGIHNATAYVLEDWPWYTNLVGARYESEIGTQPLVLRVVDRTHPSTRGLPATIRMNEEAYNFDVDPRTRGAKVLVELDEKASGAGTMGAHHPFSWYRLYDGGRSWYTTGGANSADYDNELFVRHVLGGIRWAGRLP